MKIAITGASGFVGRQLVPRLAGAGATLLLIGRNKERLAALLPGHRVADYDGWDAEAAGFDLLVHLAVENTGSRASEPQMRAVNVGLAVETARRAAAAGIERFVLTSSIHALDDTRTTAYARTKRQAAGQLAAVEGIAIVTVYLPPVHGDGWSGRLSTLNTLPRPLSRVLFPVLSALSPTVHIDKLCQFIRDGAPAGPDGMPVLTSGQGRNRVYQLSRRLADLVAGIVLIGSLWWLMALIALAIRIDTPGAPLYAQRRVGRHGKPFTLYKFRTMHAGTRQAATHEVSSGAVTRVGRFLRRTKIDELPQAWNLVLNQMSLVGPRPCLTTQSELIEARRARDVLSLKPGMTGLAQVEGIDMSQPERLARRDGRYLALQSLSLDVKVLIGTVFGGGRGDRTTGGHTPATKRPGGKAGIKP